MHFGTTKGSIFTTFGCILLPTLSSFSFTLYVLMYIMCYKLHNLMCFYPI